MNGVVEILKQLAILPNDPTDSKLGAHVVAICDTYPAALRRAGKQDAPQCAKIRRLHQVAGRLPQMCRPVIIATPTASHKEIALAALAAGKAYVY